MHKPESWLAILRRVTEEERICTSPLSRNMRPSVTYFSSESLVFPKGFFMVKFSTYFSSGSSKDAIFPSSHSLQSISVGKIFDKLAILKETRRYCDLGFKSNAEEPFFNDYTLVYRLYLPYFLSVVFFPSYVIVASKQHVLELPYCTDVRNS